MVSRLRARAWSKSNSSSDLRAGNRAARIRPSPPWVSRAETSRCRQAMRNSSCDQDSARARSASRSTDSRSVGAFNARVRKAISPVRSRLAVLRVVAITPPRRRGRARCHSRLSARTSTSVWALGAAPARPVPAQPRRGGDMLGVADRLVPGPDPGMVRDHPPVAEHLDPGQVGHHLDPAADDRRVHRVVVAVQPDVVVPGQPGRDSPPGRRRHRRQRDHRGPVRGDPITRGAAQRPAGPLIDQGQPLPRAGR